MSREEDLDNKMREAVGRAVSGTPEDARRIGDMEVYYLIRERAKLLTSARKKARNLNRDSYRRRM